MTHDDLDYTLSCLRRSVENGSAWTLYPAGAAALVAEVERLRAEVDAERAAVSTLLRSVGLSLLAVAVERGEHLRLVEAVERGEHRREEE